MKHKIQTKLFVKNDIKMDKNYDPDNYANELIEDFIVDYDVKYFNAALEFDDFKITNKKDDNIKQK